VEHARPAAPADLEAVATLAREAIAELAPQRGGAIWRLQAGRREPVDAGIAAQIDRRAAEGAFVVGTVDDAVVGYGCSTLERLAEGRLLAVVTDLYVAPEARGIGVGEAMMDLLVAHAEASGALGIDALALPGDRETKNFFETFGLKARAIVVHRPLGAAAAGEEGEGGS
jgi:GNAT superfamily N-acetyltransferase